MSKDLIVVCTGDGKIRVYNTQEKNHANGGKPAEEEEGEEKGAAEKEKNAEGSKKLGKFAKKRLKKQASIAEQRKAISTETMTAGQKRPIFELPVCHNRERSGQYTGACLKQVRPVVSSVLGGSTLITADNVGNIDM